MRAQNSVHISYVCEMFGLKSAIECIKSGNTFVFIFQVCTHETYIISKILEERTCKWARQYRNAKIWVLLCQRTDYWYKHSYITNSRESYYENVWSLHRSLTKPSQREGCFIVLLLVERQ